MVDPTGRPYWYLLTNKHWFKKNYRIAALSLSYMLMLPVRRSTLWLVKCHEFKLCLSKWRTRKWALSIGGGWVSLLQDGRRVQAPDGAGCKIILDALRIPKTLTRDGRVVIPGGLRIKSAIASVKILYIAMLIMILIAVDLVCLGIFLFHCRITRVDRWPDHRLR